MKNKLWIISDRGCRLFLYDPKLNRVIQSFAIEYTRNGKSRKVQNAEGVTYDPVTSKRYVASDKERRLYVYRVSAKKRQAKIARV